MSETSEMVADELLAPWRPMSEAPRDGTPILAMYRDCSGPVMIAWGEPDTLDVCSEGQWFQFNGGPGDWSQSDAGYDDYYGWVPMPPMKSRIKRAA